MRKGLILLVGFVLFLSACQQASIQVTPTIAPTGVLTPYHTSTSQSNPPTATIVVTIPETPAPTPTPFLYTVKNEDTMLGIAYQFGISLEDLQAANPTVDPHFMSTGLQLVIPIEGEIPETIPTATTYPVQTKQPVCYPAGDGGAWCIMAISNKQDVSLENLSAWIGLYSRQGENITSQIVYGPLNILYPGSTMPLMAYFPPPLPVNFIGRGEVVSALPVDENDTRYLEADINIQNQEITANGLQVVISGEVLLPDDTPEPSQVWVLAVAYDQSGNIVGTRKWKAAGEKQFELSVYSLGGKIIDVQVLAEVRP